MGPTAVGKSDLLLDICNAEHEVISADSMQVYRHLDIGTAKPIRGVRNRIPHHLIDVADPACQFTVGEFVRRADALTAAIVNRKHVPIVSGGTAFYVKSFVCGLPCCPPGCPVERSRLKKACRERGSAYLYSELKRVDPTSAAKIHQNDEYRIIRALEVHATAKRNLSTFARPTEARECYAFLLIGLSRERRALYARIDRRVEQMFAEGLADEVRRLLNAGYREQDPGMRGIGYKEFFEMKRGCMSMEALKELIKRNSRRFAKRQLTAFRSLPGVRWFQADDAQGIADTVARFLGSSEPPLDSISSV